MATVFRRMWAECAIPILYGEGFTNNPSGFVWVANVAMQPYSFGSVLSDSPGTAGGDCVIKIEIDGAVLDECKKHNKGHGLVYYEVPADKLNLGERELYATGYKSMAREEMVALLEALKADPTKGKDPSWLGWQIPKRWECAIELLDRAGCFPMYFNPVETGFGTWGVVTNLNQENIAIATLSQQVPPLTEAYYTLYDAEEAATRWAIWWEHAAS